MTKEAADLLASCKELRAALAGAMRVISNATLYKADIIDDFVDEMKSIGIVDGVGGRADAAIANAEKMP